MMVIDNKYNFGDIVYLKTDKDQLPRMVVRLSVKQTEIQYCIANGINETWHLDIELSETINVLLKTEG